ncbi:MAG: hypothetical protein SGI92_23195 [Bryobacteraceae bacterium]|nr:hypothetical protein [Bryobacteraceae bacterium]
MKKSSVDEARGEVIIPSFKSRREEAQWFDTHSDALMERLKKHGKVAGPLISRKPDPPPTKAISIRVSVDDIAKAKEIAKEQGIGYQTVLKDAIREGLRK